MGQAPLAERSTIRGKLHDVLCDNGHAVVQIDCRGSVMRCVPESWGHARNSGNIGIKVRRRGHATRQVPIA